MLDDEKIIDAEVLSETTVEPPPQEKPKTVSSDHSKQIDFYGKLSTWLLRIGRGTLGPLLIAGLAFSILQSQSDAPAFLVLMIVFWCLACVSVLFMMAGYLFRRRLLVHMRQDPNYNDYDEDE